MKFMLEDCTGEWLAQNGSPTLIDGDTDRPLVYADPRYEGTDEAPRRHLAVTKNGLVIPFEGGVNIAAHIARI